MKKFIQLCSFVFLSVTLWLGYLQVGFAQTAIVVHPSNDVTLTKKQISRIFLGKLRRFPGGGKALAVNLTEDNDIRIDFDRKILKKSPAQMKSYWAMQQFTGKGVPPASATDAESVKALVSDNANMIGYIDESEVDDRVRVIFSF